MISKVAHSPSRSGPRAFQLEDFFKLREHQSPCSRDRALRQTPARGCRGMCSDPLDPGGEVRGCSVGCTLAMSDISPCRLEVQREFPELQKCILKRVWFGRGDISCFFPLERTRPSASMKPPCLIYPSTSSGVRTGVHSLISVSVCLRV